MIKYIKGIELRILNVKYLLISRPNHQWNIRSCSFSECSFYCSMIQQSTAEKHEVYLQHVLYRQIMDGFYLWLQTLHCHWFFMSSTYPHFKTPSEFMYLLQIHLQKANTYLLHSVLDIFS